MKQSDIFTIILTASIGVIVSFILVNVLLGDPNSYYVMFKTIDPIDSGLSEPDPEMYNVDAINPTVEVYVGDCEDVDQNGLLDEAELIACGRATIDTSAQDEANGVDGSSSGSGTNNTAR